MSRTWALSRETQLPFVEMKCVELRQVIGVVVVVDEDVVVVVVVAVVKGNVKS